MVQERSQPVYLERHIARLLLVLYHVGKPVASLIDGETRQVDSFWQLQRFDFWVREPGHLALALLDLYRVSPGNLADHLAVLHQALARMMADDNADRHRLPVPGAPYNVFDDFDQHLSFLTSRALISDRPSFTRSRSHGHRIILETRGVNVAWQIIESCPAYAWYRLQCETIATFFPLLEKYDLMAMTYLAPELAPAATAATALVPFIWQRYTKTFGEPVHADVRETGTGDSPEAGLQL